MKKEKYYPAKHAEEQFHCPHCDVYAKQFWANLEARQIWPYGSIYGKMIFRENLDMAWTISRCEHCNQKVFWFDEKIIYPKETVVELPNDDLSEDIKRDYIEASKIFNDSPRSSAALLRLALQKLCKQLGERGTNINEDIKNLVKKGLSPQIQKSLDILRISGNNAVHPGEIDINENPELVLKLFELINFISEKMITEVKELESFYQELPENAKKQIEKRDSNN